MNYVVIFLCIPIVTRIAAQLNAGTGVCHSTELITVTRVVQREVVIGTTEVPCIINSFLDELSCMNRPTEIRNVTEMRNTTEEMKIPEIKRFCCPGYQLVYGRCSFVTTTQITTTPELTTTQRETTTQVTSTTEEKTTEVQSTTQTTELTTIQISTTLSMTQDKTEQTTEVSVNKKPRTQTTERTTMQKPTDKTIKQESTPDSSAINYTIIYIVAICCVLFVLFSFVTMLVVIRMNSRRNNRRSHDTEIGMETIRINGINHIINQTNDCSVPAVPIPICQTNGQRALSTPITTCQTNGYAVSNTPVTACGIMTTDQCVDKSTAPHRRTHESIFTARSQNFQNEYTELRMSNSNQRSSEATPGATYDGSDQYDDLIGFLEDPFSLYEELPDCDDIPICQNTETIEDKPNLS